MEREIAINILMDYETKKTYLNIALANGLPDTMTQAGKNLVTRLVYGTVQYRLRLDYELRPWIKGKRVRTFERMVLLMSVYEHLYLDMPDYAIVDEAVKLTKKNRGRRSATFVNAVLRHCFNNPQDLDGLDEDMRLSIEESIPLWIVKMFTHQYGQEATKKICHSFNEIPLKSARVNTLHLTREQFLEKYKGFEQGHLSDDAVILKKGILTNHPAFINGDMIIQDESAQKVAQLLNPSGADEVVDMCSAPGGKTTHLAALMNNKGHIDACDIYVHKGKLILENCDRLGVTNVSVIIGDSTDLSIFNGKQYDKVLLDGPCTGLGVLGRKPEIRYHDSEIMDKIIPIQQKLLDNAYSLCKNKGNIVYSTCTLNKKENETQIASLIKRHKDLHIVQERTIFPYEYHSDGFYMCLLEKD